MNHQCGLSPCKSALLLSKTERQITKCDAQRRFRGDASAGGRMAGSLKVPDRDEQKEERRNGGDEAVNTNLANKTELKVHEVNRGSGAYSGVENRAKTQTARQRIEGESRG